MTADQQPTYSGTTVAVVIFALIAGGLLYRYWPDDERAIKRHLSNMAEALSVVPGGSEAADITRLAALREYFAPEVLIRVGDREVASSRDALVGILSRWTPPPGGVVVEFVGVQVTLADDHETAQVDLTANVSSTNPNTGESTLDTSLARVDMAKRERDWVITRAESRAVPDPQ